MKRITADVSPRSKDVLAILIDRSNGQPLEITQKELSIEAGISQRWLINSINELVCANLLTRKSPPSGRTNIYEIKDC